MRAAVEWAAKDPAVVARLRDVAETEKEGALSVVLLAIGDGGTYWCGAVGPYTGPEEGSA